MAAKRDLKYLTRWELYWYSRWYSNNCGYCIGIVCETVDIITKEGRVMCLVLNIENNKVGGIVLDDDTKIKPGQYVICSGILMSVPTGESLLGRIVDPLGKPVDDKGPIVSRVLEWLKLLHLQLFLEHL